MHPVLFGSLNSYFACLLLAVAAGGATVMAGAARDGISPRAVAPALAVVAVGALVGSKLDSIFERGGTVYALTWEATNGFRYPGGILGCAVGLATVARRSARRGLTVATVADLLAPACGFGIAAARVGCFLDGCCFGRVSHLPWAIRFPAGSGPWRLHVAWGLLASTAPASLPVHPLQLYFLAWALALGCLAWRHLKHRAYAGQTMLLFLALHGTGKFLLESLRATPVWHVRLLAAGFGLAAGAALLIRAGMRGPRQQPSLPAAQYPARTTAQPPRPKLPCPFGLCAAAHKPKGHDLRRRDEGTLYYPARRLPPVELHRSPTDGKLRSCFLTDA